ncbi:MAG: hypothetical protein WBD41_07715 [Rhodococcus sp. (in: high G+C Gram-positive bacteria)]
MSDSDDTSPDTGHWAIAAPFDVAYESDSVETLPGRTHGKSPAPQRPTGVVLRAPVMDPTTGEQRIDKYKRPVFTEYGCSVVYAGRLDDDQDNTYEDIWQVVCHRWMHPGDQVVADFVPARAVLIGPPPAVQNVAQEAAHA